MIYKRKFRSLHSRNSFLRKIHMNRIHSFYSFKDNEGKINWGVKYYRDTKKLRKLHNFPEPWF